MMIYARSLAMDDDEGKFELYDLDLDDDDAMMMERSYKNN